VPFAIWQDDDRTSLVDRTGAVIADGVVSRYAGLPLVVGSGAAERAAEFTNMIGAFPDIAWRVRAGAWVSDRRWTVVLDNDVVIMLPQDDPAGALDRVSRLDAQTGLLSRAIAAVDLRMGDRLVVRLTDDGLAARNGLLKARTTAGGRARTNT
jgi:cell division protein FtsQ